MSPVDFRMQLKPYYQRIHDAPLDAGNIDDVTLYEPIYRRREDEQELETDPVEKLARHVEWEDTQSMQLLSGFRGAGKTTELLRLRKRLASQGYIVLYANALEYINPGGPLDITDLLLNLAGAFSDQLLDPAILGNDLKVDPFWKRISAFLKRINVDVDVSFPGLSIKAELKSSPTFRQQLQSALAGHVTALKAQVDDFIQECVAAVDCYQQKSQAVVRPLVMLFDSLEQIRGTNSNEKAVQESIEKVFGHHLDKLKFPSVHVVYTVPPWLKFVAGSVGHIVVLPSVRQWEHDSSRTPFEPGNQDLRNVLLKRFGEDGCKLIFGSLERAQPLIAHCGGHFRDLLLLVRHTMLMASSLPVSDAAIQQALQEVRSQYLPLSIADARWLKRIADTRAANQRDPEDNTRLVRFLDAHLVLYLRNGSEWYDVHPLIREEVESVVARSEVN